MQTTPAVESLGNGAFQSRVYSRIGLLGNPSDGYNGRCLSLSLQNFWAEVVIKPSSKINFEVNPEGDPTQFTDLSSFVSHIDGHGYNGGVRLLMSMARQFLKYFKYCSEHDIPLDSTSKFSLSYSTNIPRQRGLSGSSAIACAALNCLIAFYKISGDVLPLNHRPGLVLAAEEALGITAGLQDRIIQVYGGLVSMDFSEYNSKYSFPPCKSLDPGLLPPLILIYNPDEAPGKDSGSLHSQFKEKFWALGDSILHDQMKEVADLVPQGIAALDCKDFEKLAILMKRNFQLRKLMFGEAALGKESLKMIEIADSVHVAAKFTGSGGAVVALPLDEEQKRKLEEASRRAGFVCVPVRAGPVYHII